MKSLLFAAGAALLAGNLAAFADTDVSCGQPLDAPLRSRAVLVIDSVSSGLEIVGTDQQTLRVSCSASEAETTQRARVHLAGNQDEGKLTITGPSGDNRNIKIRVEVPRKTNLKVRMNAGEVKVEDVAGDKDIEIRAGRIAISSAHKADYRNVDLSVIVGAVKAPVYAVDKGGFFRSYDEKNSAGEYGLHAHLIAGEIDLSAQAKAGAE